MGNGEQLETWMNPRYIPVVLAAAVAGYVYADLYLRVDLPGAAWLAHQAFRGIVGPLEWLTEGGNTRLYAAVGAWAVCVVLAAVWRAARGVVWGSTCVLVASAQLLVVALASLMERALAAGFAVALCVALLSGALGWDDEGRGRWAKWAVALAVAAVGAVACYYIFAMFMTYGEGYALLRWAGDLVRLRGVQLLPLFAACSAVVAVGAMVALVRLPGRRARRMRGLALSAAAGIVVAAALEILLRQGAALWPLLLVVPAGVSISSLAWLPLVRRPLQRGWRVGALPQVLLLPCLLACLLLGHTYTARVFRCDRLETIPGLEHVTSPAEIFRVTLSRDATVAAVSLRTSRRLGWLPTSATAGDLSYTLTGPAGLEGPGDPQGEWTLNGVPEELVYAPALDVFFVTLSPDRYDRIELDGLVHSHGRGELTNVLLIVSGDGAQVIEAVGVPGLCWINTLRWSDTENLLYIGCEDRPGVHRYEPLSRTFLDGNDSRVIGDVQKIALVPSRSRLYTVSLWKRPTLTELDLETLSPLRQTIIGGSHYDVVYDPGSERLFASAYYGSRVHVVDASTMNRMPSIPAGLGTRALSVADDLLLVSSVYDGLLRVCDPASGEVRHSLPVGGHVKDFAFDPERDMVWFWSQCGLMRLDLGKMRDPSTRREGR